MSRLLHVDDLIVRKACPSAVAKFRELCGECVYVTRDLCLKHADDFAGSWHWAASRLLSPRAYAKWKLAEDVALTELHAADVRGAEAFHAGAKKAELLRGGGLEAPTEYARAMTLARDDYRRARAGARKELAAASAAAFADAYIGDKGSAP